MLGTVRVACYCYMSKKKKKKNHLHQLMINIKFKQKGELLFSCLGVFNCCYIIILIINKYEKAGSCQTPALSVFTASRFSSNVAKENLL